LSRTAAGGALLEQIFEQRLNVAERGQVPSITLDHNLVPEAVAAWMLAVAPRLRGGPAAPPATIVCADRTDPGRSIDPTGTSDALREAAGARGCVFVPPGEGTALQVYVERFAAPGASLAGPATLAAAGAIGVMLNPVDALQSAAVMRGARLRFEPLRRVRCALEGSLGPAAHGLDAAQAVLARLPSGTQIVEFTGPALPAFAMRHRLALARRLGAAGVLTLFLGDDVAHKFTAAIGREVETRTLVPFDDSAADLRCDLDAVEPLIWDGVRADAARPVRSIAGAAVREVTIGPAATLEDLVAFTRLVDVVTPPTRVVVRPGSRRILEAGATLGLWADLRARGVVVTPEPVAAERRRDADRLVERLEFGSESDPMHEAGPETCAAAVSGRITDPREREAALLSEPALVRAGRPPRTVPPTADPIAWADPPVSTPARWGRGIVLARLGDGITARRGLAVGARGEARLGALDYLAGRVLASEMEGFAAHATKFGGGWLLAGARFGGGADADRFAVALADIGVRGVMAIGYGEGATWALARAGVLALEDDGRSGIRAGEEIEIPGLPEEVGASTMVTVRNLTRGSQRVMRHAFADHEAAEFRDGGWLAPLVRGE